MGKKRIIQKSDASGEGGGKPAPASTSKKKLAEGSVHIQSTYNNTLISITDERGGVVLSASAGSLGFSGAKKGTPYAATKVAEFLGEKAKAMGLGTISIFIKGVGAGRESALRSFAAQGFNINIIRDVTPIPHNGPRLRKPRRV